MLYIVDGAELTGRKGLAKNIATHLDLEYKKIDSKLNYDDHYKSLSKDKNVVYDGSFIGALAREEDNITFNLFLDLFEVIKERDIKVIITTADDVEFTTRLMEVDDIDNYTDLVNIDRRFKAIGTLFDIKVVNPSDLRYDQILEAIKRDGE